MSHKNEVEAANVQFMKQFSDQNASGLAGLYTSGGQVMAANAPLIDGQSAVADFWQSVFDAGIAGAVLKTVEVVGDDENLSEVGRFELKTADGTIADHGNYVVLWAKENGQWKLHRDIFTSVVPAT